MTAPQQRIIGLDILRTLAIVCVVCGHFFTVNTPFNDTPYAGTSMMLQGFLKTVFGSMGVPLFLMLSGYLCCTKKFSLTYYKGIARVLIAYLIISLITWCVLSPSHSLSELVWGVLGFKTIGYAWYIEMYIGLFLLIPFINMIVEKVHESNNRQMLWVLIATMLLLTAIPTMVSRGGHVIVSRYWEMNFPVTFYLVGAYIRLYQPRLSWKWWPAVFVIPAINLISSELMGGGKFIGLTGSYYSVVNIAVLYVVFVLLYKIKDCPCRSVITSISLYSLEMFLFSYVIDKTLYPLFIERFYTTQADFILWFLPITISSLTLSYLCARLLNFITKPLTNYLINRT